MNRIALLPLAVRIGLTSAAALTAAASSSAQQPTAPRPAAPTPAPWPMFHRNERHTGVITDAVGDFLPGGPLVRWTYQVYTPTDQITNVRWTATMPLGDLLGDGKLEAIVTTPGGSGAPDRVIALQDAPGQSPPVHPLWIYTSTLPLTETNSYDQYSSALVDVDGDGKPDVVFTDNKGVVRALKGTNGQLLWSYDTNHYIESGPMVADLNGDGKQEVIVATGCDLALDGCPAFRTDSGALFVLAAAPTATLIYSATFPYKMDSAEPVIADIDHTDGTARKAIILGTWGGYLLTVWRSGNDIITNTLNIRELVSPTVPMSMPSAIRSSPLVADFGEGPTAVFGWVPSEQSPVDAYISAVGLSANMLAGTIHFTPRWSYPVDAWKSSVALLPVTNPPLVVAGYGIAVPPDSNSGAVGACDPPQVRGGIIALDYQGHVAWHHDYGGVEGNIRGSVAVADLNGDGVLDVVLPVGCYGALKTYNGATGELEWVRQLGPRTQASPSLGDLNGDGKLEIVVASYDGNVYAFEGGARIYLSLVVRQ